MSLTGRTDADGEPPAASDVAAALRNATFVRLIADATGDALAATSLLAGGLDALGTPYQATVAAFPGDADRSTEADLTVALGRPDPAADLALSGTASPTAHAAATELGAADPVVALAGAIAADDRPAEGDLAAAAPAAGPGVATPVTDPVEGIAHSTLVHGPFSGDPEAAADLLSGLEGTDGRAVASRVALAVAGDEDGTARGAAAVERFIGVREAGPFGTVGGYADVMEALARTDPGLGVAVALGRGDRDVALAAWRDHGRAAHTAIRKGTTGRYDGLFVLRCPAGAPVGTVARLAASFRSPEPVALAVTDAEAAAVSTGDTDIDVAARTEAAASAVSGEAAGTAESARARFGADATEFVAAFRGEQ